ncbi:hypothetical protein [Bacillus solimangrovi]
MRLHVRLFLLMLCFLMLVSCSSAQLVKEAASHKLSIKEKEEISVSFFTNKTIIPNQSEGQSFHGVVDWYDNDSVLYLGQEGSFSNIYTYDLFSGKSNLFYSSEHLISEVSSNESNTLFAVQSVQTNQKTLLQILDREGEEFFRWDGYVDRVQVMWHPLKDKELILSVLEKDWTFSVLHVNIVTGNLTPIDVDNPFVQWVDNDHIAYLNWYQDEQSFTAPVIITDVNSMEVEHTLQDFFAIFSFPHYLLGLSSIGPSHDLAQFTFYDSMTLNEIVQMTVPVLQTYSEQQWIPNYSFDSHNEIFYYFRPIHSGNISKYDNDFELTSFSLRDQEEKVIHVSERNVPLKVSPDGSLCIVGDRLENVIIFESGQLVPLFM